MVLPRAAPWGQAWGGRGPSPPVFPRHGGDFSAGPPEERTVWPAGRQARRSLAVGRVTSRAVRPPAGRSARLGGRSENQSLCATATTPPPGRPARACATSAAANVDLPVRGVSVAAADAVPDLRAAGRLRRRPSAPDSERGTSYDGLGSGRPRPQPGTGPAAAHSGHLRPAVHDGHLPVHQKLRQVCDRPARAAVSSRLLTASVYVTVAALTSTPVCRCGCFGAGLSADGIFRLTGTVAVRGSRVWPRRGHLCRSLRPRALAPLDRSRDVRRMSAGRAALGHVAAAGR